MQRVLEQKLASTLSSPALPQVVDRSHPAWAEVNAEQTEREPGS